MKQVRVLAMVLVILLTVLPLFGNGNAEATSKKRVEVNPAGVFPIVEEKVVISAFVEQGAQVEDLPTNEATMAMEEKTNIHLDMVVVPTDAVTEKKQLLLASGDYPEVFMSGNFSNEDLMKYGANEGVFIPLNDLIKEYAPNIMAAEKDMPGFLKSITAPDGNIYGIPVVNECYHCSYNPKFWVYQPWLETLGLEIPETTEDFYAMLVAFKTQDPNGNGIADEIPLSGSPTGWYSKTEHYIMNAFVYDDGASRNEEYFFEAKDGKLSFVANSQGWREGLRYMNRLYNEGLFDPAAFTQDYSQLRQMGNNEGAVILGSTSGGHPGVFVTLNEDNPRHKGYVSVPPLRGPDGQRHAVPTPFKAVKGAQFTITDKCQNPEAAIRLADYIYSFEGTMLLDVGVEGNTWRRGNANELDFSGHQAAWTQTADFMEIDNTSWKGVGPTFRSFTSVRGTKAQPQDPLAPNGLETRLFIATSENYEPYAPQEAFLGNVFLGLEDIETAAQLRLHVVDYVKQSMIRFITGDMDVDADWDGYVESLEKLGVDQYVAVYQEAYQ